MIQHTSLIMTWCFVEYRGNANFVYVIFWWYLVEPVCVNGACIHTYWPGFVGFHEKWHFSWKVHENHQKAPKKQQKQMIQHTSLIMTWCFVEYRGKANKIYLIFWWYLVVYVVHVCLNGTCIHTYWPGFVGFHEKWCFLCESWYFCEKHMKSTENWKAHEKWKAHLKSENHLKSEKHMKIEKKTWKAYLKSESI